eukprot:7390972-Prymnesium_polylepis.1
MGKTAALEHSLCGALPCGERDPDPFARRNTLCTVVAFDAVATAIAECAFVVSELPVVLSLEVEAA